MRTACIVLLAAILLGPMAAPGFAEFKPGAGEIKGYMVCEYYYIASQHDSVIDGSHGFWFRRIYFTYENQLSSNVMMRLRLEMNSPGDFESSDLLTPYVKDAFLRANAAGQRLTFGLTEPPSILYVEKVWGYRPLEKTPLDLHMWTSPRDLGVSLMGGEKLHYEVMFGNGSGTGGELYRGKKIYGTVGYQSSGILTYAMTQYEAAENDVGDFIIQGFGGYRGSWGRVGLQYAYRKLMQEGTEDLPYNVLSLFAIVFGGNKWEFIGRYDKYFGEGYRTSFAGHEIDYIPFADNAESNFFIGAVAYKIKEDIKLMPNLKYVYYERKEGGETPGDDLYVNLTLYFKF